MELKGLRRKVTGTRPCLYGGHAGITVETCSLPIQVKVVRYLVGGPSVLTAEDLARHDDEIARKTDVVMLSSEQVQKAHRNLVNVLRNAGCSKVLEIVRVSLGAGISMENLLVYMGVQRFSVSRFRNNVLVCMGTGHYVPTHCLPCNCTLS